MQIRYLWVENLIRKTAGLAGGKKGKCVSIISITFVRKVSASDK
jgi:hypothetical protein